MAIFWQLRGLRGCYGAFVAVTGSTWLLQGLRSCYGVYVAVTGTTWMLRGLCVCYGDYVDVMGSVSRSFSRELHFVALTGRLLCVGCDRGMRDLDRSLMYLTLFGENSIEMLLITTTLAQIQTF